MQSTSDSVDAPPAADPIDTAEVTARIAAIVHPPTYCPGCLAAAGTPWPVGATTQHCASCLAAIRRTHQCQQWNADPDHQHTAGKARAQAFTSEYQAAAAHAQQTQFSALWRAEQGLAPLSAAAVRRYLTPQLIRGPLGRRIDATLQARIYRAWCAGYLYGVALWLNQPAWGTELDAALDRAERGMTQPPLLAVPDEFAEAWSPGVAE